MDVAGGIELDCEEAIGGDGVGDCVVGDETLWETVFREKVVDVCGCGRNHME